VAGEIVAVVGLRGFATGDSTLLPVQAGSFVS
jgi:hypothetical protein